MAKYRTGVIKSNQKGRCIASCSCRTVKLLKEEDYYEAVRAKVECEKCGNTNFLFFGDNKNRELIPHLEVLNKDRKGFKIKRTNLSVIIDEEFNLSFKENQIQVMSYDLANNKIEIWKNGDKIEMGDDIRRYPDLIDYQRFFHKIDDSDFVDMVKVKETENLFDMAWKDLSDGRSWSAPKKIYRGLVKVFDYKYLQILANAGYPNISRFKARRVHYSNTINTNGTTPRGIFGLPKFLLSYIRENQSVGIHQIEQIKKALTKVEANRFREVLEIVKDESTISELCHCLDTLIEIHDKYNYRNMKKLTLYLFREIRMNQGISSPSNGATLLHDYINMATKLGQEYEKYPKSLKKEHDITMMNYRVKESEIKQKEFVEKVLSEDYKSIELKTKELSIISPKSMDELIKEGNELSHCVASYVDSIIKDSCKIYFLRMTKVLDQPYATIEVRGDRIRQARGYANRALTASEREFISKWAEKKNLVENYYY